MFDYYEVLDWDSFSKKYFLYVKEIVLKKNNILTHHDLACWSWYFVNQMLLNWIISTWSNISDEQISIAKCRYWQEYFSIKDMTDFSLDSKVDFITCNNDAINHLYSIEQWWLLFKNVYNNLNEKWYFLFDFHTLKKIKLLEKNISNFSLSWFNILSSEEYIWNNFYRSNCVIYNNLDNSILKILSSYHTSFSEDEVYSSLLHSWFKNYRILSISNSNRIYILAFKY